MVALTCSLNEDNTWIIDSGAPRHMTRDRKEIHTLSKEQYSHALELGDNKNYVVKGLGSTSLKLDNGAKLHLNKILYVIALKTNLLSIYCLEDKGDKVAFVYGKLLVWGKYSSIDKVKFIDVKECYIDL